MTWSQLVATVITALGAGGLVSLLLYRVQRSKTVAETDKITTDGEVSLSAEVRQWFTEARLATERAEMKANRCSARIEQLEDHIDNLERLMRDAGIANVPAKPAMPPWPGANATTSA